VSEVINIIRISYWYDTIW